PDRPRSCRPRPKRGPRHRAARRPQSPRRPSGSFVALRIAGAWKRGPGAISAAWRLTPLEWQPTERRQWARSRRIENIAYAKIPRTANSGPPPSPGWGAMGEGDPPTNRGGRQPAKVQGAGARLLGTALQGASTPKALRSL